MVKTLSKHLFETPKNKLTTDIFIDRSKDNHGETYDYSLVDYKNWETKVDIICPKHGVFSQSPYVHMKGGGCPICGKKGAQESRRLTKDEFVKKAREIHGDKYDYSSSIYLGNRTPIEITCEKHGPFIQRPSNHIGPNRSGCPICGDERIGEKNSKNTEDFTKTSKEIHGDTYDYSLVDYKGNRSPVTIICNKHGEFQQTPTTHLKGSGCPKCAGNLRKTSEEFIIQAKKVHGNKYDYSKTNYVNHRDPVSIICSKHGEFSQIPQNHLVGSGCPICSESKGEKLVTFILEKNNITFQRQKKFLSCYTRGFKDKRCIRLPFDFYLPKYNTVIEYDGVQHFRPVSIFGGENEFARIKIRDKIKNSFCKTNGIKIIRIPYTMNKEQVEEYLKKEL